MLVGLVLALVVLLCLLWGFLGEVELLRLRKYELKISKLPEHLDGLRLLLITDLHLGRGMPPARLARFCHKMSKLDLDLLLFAGDLSENAQRPEVYERWPELGAALASIPVRWGKFACQGNHDVESPAALDFFARSLKAGGFSLLQDECWQQDALRLVGLADRFQTDSAELSCAYAALAAPLRPALALEILLLHEPDLCTLLPPAPHPRLQLSGHSHNGQITFFGLPLYRERLGWRYRHGLYQLAGQEQYLLTSAGLGQVKIHARFANPPECVLLTLRRS